MKKAYYKSGRKPQYGKDRWARYESLRENGFTKEEARQLSRTTSPQGKDVVRNMIEQRHKLFLQYAKKVEANKWEFSKARYNWYKEIRNWYERNNLTSKQGVATPRAKGGKPDLYVWYNRTENLMAKKRGWKKGERGIERRPKPKTPPRKDYKGNVKRQRRRAKIRAKAFKQQPVAPRLTSVDTLRKWLKESQGMIHRDATPAQRKVSREWRAGLRQRIRKAELEQKAGRPAVA